MAIGEFMEEIEQPKAEIGGAQPDLPEGSIMGKFKDATSLSKAYANLQAEFTRKSQKLAELERKMSGTEQSSEEDVVAPQSADTEQQNVQNLQQNISGENDCREQNFGSNDDFDAVLSKKLLKFAENNPDAINYLKDVKAELIKAKDLAEIEGGIEIAYRLATAKSKFKPAELLSNPDYIKQYVLQNDQVNKMVIDNYVKSLATIDAPKVISGGSSSVVVAPNYQKPKTLSDANKIFSKMLEK